ncbi:MAG: hypothetical protein HY881_24845 [Deltaproteobacteria bacterium]|nr:hypothetical protein [Deltaproteobacteria bacterium]
MTKQRFMIFFLFGAIMLFLMGNAAADSDTSKSETSQSAVQKDQGSAPVYRDFGDVLVPSEMEPDADSSFVYITSGLTVGVMTVKGRVETDSLIAFFQNNMAKDNWKLISYFKSPKTLMLFRKETRWSAINITEGSYYTYAEIWVAPTVADADTGLMK